MSFLDRAVLCCPCLKIGSSAIIIYAVLRYVDLFLFQRQPSKGKFKLHHYQRLADEFCSMCSACKKHDDVRRTFTDFRESSLHKQGRKSNTAYMASKPLEDLPVPMVNAGVHLCRFLHDTTHSQLLGTSKVLNGSVLTYLIEVGEFGQFPARGFYEHAFQGLCRPAYLNFKAWLKRHNLDCDAAAVHCIEAQPQAPRSVSVSCVQGHQWQAGVILACGYLPAQTAACKCV